MSESAWRAVYCKPRQERRAEAHLENQGFRVFLPRIRTRQRRHGQTRVRVEPLFPRYLFIALREFADDWSTIRSTRGVVGLVRFGDQFPVISDEFVDALMRRHAEAGAIDISQASEFQENDCVEISDGALAGLRAVFKADSGEERVTVLLNMLNTTRTVEVPREYLRKVV